MTAEEYVEPTPVFASHRSLQLHLPVPAKAVTQLGFHQASGDAALHMTSLVPDANMRTAAKTREMRRRPADHDPAEAVEVAAAEQGLPQLFNGEALRLWRSNRSGRPDTAADVGAAPGTRVVAPVTGTVLRVRRYWLYGEHEDFEIHIQPRGWPEIDVVLIHIAEVSVAEGDEVRAGITPIAAVRRLSDKVIPQLGQYTKDGGDHVHVQLNRLEVPGKLDLIGGS